VHRDGIDMNEISDVASALKHVRDKTHFHIDRDGVLDPKQIWRDAGLTGRRLSDAMDCVWRMLNEVQRNIGGVEQGLLEYDASVAERVALMLEKDGAHGAA
jgi:hypothetical protein